MNYCQTCGFADSLHDSDGECPRITQGKADPPNLNLGIVPPVPIVVNGHTYPISPKRPPGRPKGSVTQRTELRLGIATQKAIAEKMVDQAGELLAKEWEIRAPKRPGAPNRTVTEAKDAALAIINQQLWNIEGIADTVGLSADEEARVLKLLAGLNAALPKTAEEPPAKPLSEMTDAELAEAEKKKR